MKGSLRVQVSEESALTGKMLGHGTSCGLCHALFGSDRDLA